MLEVLIRQKMPLAQSINPHIYQGVEMKDEVRLEVLMDG